MHLDRPTLKRALEAVTFLNEHSEGFGWWLQPNQIIVARSKDNLGLEHYIEIHVDKDIEVEKVKLQSQAHAGDDHVIEDVGGKIDSGLLETVIEGANTNRSDRFKEAFTFEYDG